MTISPDMINPTRGHWDKAKIWAKITTDDSGCWVWSGQTDKNGYPRATIDGRTWRLQRYIYERLIGPIPDGWHVDHLCMLHACLCPAHLEAVPPPVNRQRQADANNTCRNGHLKAPENRYYWRSNGQLMERCLPCFREGQARSEAKRKRKRRALGLA